MKTAELTGALLDYWAGRADDIPVRMQEGKCVECLPLKGREIAKWADYSPSTDWAQGGPIIERERIQFEFQDWHKAAPWAACKFRAFGKVWRDETPLGAAMRAYVASKFGDEVPDQENNHA
jgi:hypothetical protein